jgi:hypothetical protein
MSTSTETIEQLASREYKYGFETEVETDTFPPGLDEQVIRRLSAIKGEPEWLLEFRLKSYRAWLAMKEPAWHNLKIAPIDYNAISYYSAPKKKPQLASMDEVDPEVRKTFEKLGIPLVEQQFLAGVAVGRRVRQRFGGHHVPRQAWRARHHLLLVLGSGEGPSRAREEVSRFGRAAHGQLLRVAQFGGVQRRVVCLHSEGRPLPDGAVHVLPHQCEEHRTVRAHADRGR